MAELTLKDVYEGLSERMDTITNELVVVGNLAKETNQRVGTIEDSLNDVQLKDLSGNRYKEPRKQFIQRIHEYMQPGGVADQKMRACADNHSSVKQLEKAGKIWDVYGKWGTRIVVVIFAIYLVFEIVDIRKAVGIVKDKEMHQTETAK
jgi:hypothetical protein